MIKRIYDLLLGPADKKINCMMLGAAKSGTTTLSKYLSVHPDVAFGPTKEIHYFDWRYDQSSDWYEGLFPARKKYKVDATPYYLFHPLIPARVKAYNPTCKFIVLLRNPSDRAVSHYFHNVKIKNMKGKELSHWRTFLPLDEELPIEEAFRQEEERLKGQYELVHQHAEDRTYNNHQLQHFSYKARGHYAEQLKRWFDLFPREQFLLLDFEDLTHAPQETLKRVYDFLGIKSVFPSSYDPSNQGTYATDQTIQALKEVLSAYYESHDQALRALTGMHFKWMSKV